MRESILATTAEPWYQTFFNGDYLRIYSHVLTPERAQQEAAFVEEALALQPGQRVLDLCCGTGRHALLLARRGLQVTALDLSAEYIEVLAHESRAQGLGIETVVGDMRHIPYREAFDAVINMFTAFGYLETERDDMEVLHAVAAALKPGGLLLMDLLNREWVIANNEEHDWHQDAGGSIYLERRRLDLRTSRNHVDFLVISPDGSRRHVDGHHIRLYTLTEIDHMLSTAGMAFEACYGGFSGEAYSPSSRRMIVIARRNGARGKNTEDHAGPPR